jgi:hypothetical protein
LQYSYKDDEKYDELSQFSEISGSHGGEYEDCRLLGCCAAFLHIPETRKTVNEKKKREISE